MNRRWIVGTGTMEDPVQRWTNVYLCGHTRTAPSDRDGWMVPTGTIQVPLVCLGCAIGQQNERLRKAGQ